MTKFDSVLLGATMLAAMTAQAQQIPNNTTAGWNVAGGPPAAFAPATVGGQPALQLTISSGGTPNQGEVTIVNPSQALGDWSLSGNLYVTSGQISGAAGPSSSELWAGTGALGTPTGYYILGLLSGSTARNTGAIVGSPTTSSELEIWNDLTASWTYLNDSLLAPGYNSFEITSDGVGTMNYYVDGQDVFTQTGMGGPSGDPEINDLSGLYLNGYNFYGQGAMPATGSYNIAWNDLDASVPDGWSTIGGLIAACGALAGWSRLKPAASMA